MWSEVGAGVWFVGLVLTSRRRPHRDQGVVSVQCESVCMSVGGDGVDRGVEVSMITD